MDITSIAGLRSASDLSGAIAGTDQGEELGKTAFLELMIAQINNQNPLDPAKNEEFVAQLAQFSSVEGIQNLNETMSDMASSIKSSMTLNAAGLVGRSVMATTNLASSEGGGFIGNVNIGEATSQLKVEISAAGGELLRTIDLGSQTEGTARFTWDGRDEAGNVQGSGLYRVRAFSDATGEAKEFEVQLPDRVLSVSIQPEGAIANLASGTSLPLAQVREIQ